MRSGKVMTHRERFVRTLTGRKVDRVPFIKVFGGTNAIVPAWEREHPGLGREIDRILGFEGGYRGWQVAPVNMALTRTGPPEILEDNGTRTVQRFRDGTVRVIQKDQDFSRYTIDWPVKTREDLARIKAEHLAADDPERFPADWPDYVRRYRDRDYPLQLTHGGVYGFARNVMGDENLGYAFYDDPDLVRDLLESYTTMALAVWEKMTAEVEFDLIECWEDMAFRSGALVSPRVFREFLKPQYERIADFARRHRIEILLVDSDGYIEDLAGLMLESGVTAMYPFEVQSGNDLVRVRQHFPEVGAIGGLDKQVMAAGRADIDAEIARARELIRLGRYIPGPDHFVLSDVSWENYRYFMQRLREVVMTTAPET